jgi:hypothetical protein
VETRYQFVEKLCFSLYYACTKLRYYLLCSTCIVACQPNVIKHMFDRPTFSGRHGKWAYGLIEYDLVMSHGNPLKAKLLQILLLNIGLMWSII